MHSASAVARLATRSTSTSVASAACSAAGLGGRRDLHLEPEGVRVRVLRLLVPSDCIRTTRSACARPTRARSAAAEALSVATQTSAARAATP